MLQHLTRENKKALFHLLSLLVAIYCAAILGDYVAEALVIKHYTVAAIPALFPVNAAALFVVSFLLFSFVDRLHRWQLIKALSLIFFTAVCLLSVFAYRHAWPSRFLYVTAYLSKLSLFSVFWIIANDICDTRKSKAIFPLLAGGGLLGGLLSTLFSGKIVHATQVETLLWLWALLLILPFFVIDRLSREYGFRLNAPAAEPAKSLRNEFTDLLKERSLTAMAGVYFLVFLLIFNLDFIFTSQLSRRFTLSGLFHAEGFLAYKFNVFLAVTALIILFQFVMTTFVSKRVGVIHSMLALPLVLFASFSAIFLLLDRNAATGWIFHATLLAYVLRQFVFECLFSSNYQIFFSAFSRRLRGKGKLMMEGIVKPLGIAAAGIFILASQNPAVYYLSLAAAAACLAFLIAYLKTEYSKILLSDDAVISNQDILQMIKREISGKRREKILSLIARALDSQDYDLKRVAIKYLGYSGTQDAFSLLRKKFFEESDRIRELIAGSLSNFDTLEAKGFLRQLLEDGSGGVRAGALKSIRGSVAFKPHHFELSGFIYDPDSLVFEEASRLAFPGLASEERATVVEKVGRMLRSETQEERLAGLRLTGHLRLTAFFDEAVAMLEAREAEVWRAAAAALLPFEGDRGIGALVQYLDTCTDRSKEIEIVAWLGRAPLERYPLFENFFLTAERKRTAFSLIGVLRLLALRHLNERDKPIRQTAEVKEKLERMAMEEMRSVYTDVYHYYDVRIHRPLLYRRIDLLKRAIGERRRHFGMIIVDILALLDNSGALLNIGRDFKKMEEREKANVIELIETFGEKNIGRYLIPILEDFGEQELLKIGSNEWRYVRRSFEEAVGYFRRLGNRWIGLIAIYLEYTSVKDAQLRRS